jgi:hypothetical protein
MSKVCKIVIRDYGDKRYDVEILDKNDDLAVDFVNGDMNITQAKKLALKYCKEYAVDDYVIEMDNQMIGGY